MDAIQALRDTENALRDFICAVLTRTVGPDWIDQCGVTPERVKCWTERKRVEGARQPAGVVEERLIYYADFYDLKPILKKHWAGEFADALGDWKTIEVYLSQLESLRDPTAHGRDLLPHQKELILGIAGEIRGRLVRYRNKRETTEDCFPRIESARDSLGNLWTPGESSRGDVWTEMVLHPDDGIDYVVAARDPEDAILLYAVEVIGRGSSEWQAEPEFSIRLTDRDIASLLIVRLMVRSDRDYHAWGDYDDRIDFVYKVLPKRAC